MVVIQLSALPPSTNNLFVNVKGRGRVKSKRYRAWIKASGWEILQQRAGSLAGAVGIAIEVANEARADSDNLVKPLLDLLVRQRIIEGDDPAIIREIAVKRVRCTGARVLVCPYKQEQADDDDSVDRPHRAAA